MVFDWEWAYMSESPVDAANYKGRYNVLRSYSSYRVPVCTLINYSWPTFLCCVKEKGGFL